MQNPSGDAWHRFRAGGGAAADTSGFQQQQAAAATPEATSMGSSGAKLQLFDDKIATQPARMYDDKKVAAWRKGTMNYFLGRHRHMKTFIKWIEEKGDEEITIELLESMKNGPTALMMDSCPVEASEQMWAFLNLNLQGDILETFHNVEPLNGAEAWRRVTASGSLTDGCMV